MTDLETSSNHRSASEGVRLWEGRTGEDEGGTMITGAAADQLLPVDQKKQNVSVKMSLLDVAIKLRCSPGCAEVGATTGDLAQGLVSRAGSAGGRTGGVAGGGREKAGAVPFTAAGKKQELVQRSSVGQLNDINNVTYDRLCTEHAPQQTCFPFVQSYILLTGRQKR